VGCTWESMDVTMEDQDDRASKVIGEPPWLPEPVDQLDRRRWGPDAGPYEVGRSTHQDEPYRPESRVTLGLGQLTREHCGLPPLWSERARSSRICWARG